MPKANQPTYIPEIYKYIDPAGLPILETNSIRITNPALLNDPFEALPRIPKVTDELLAAKLSESSMIQQLGERFISQGQIEQQNDAQEYIENHKDELLSNLRKYYSENADTMTPEFFRKEVGELFGITSFSETPNDILMWSHYAEKHNGFAIGFNGYEFDGYITSVIYSSARVEYSSLYHSALRDHIFFKILRTKHLPWSYEQELRAIIPWEVCRKDLDGHFYMEFDPQRVRSIVMGANCTIRDEILEIAAMKYPEAKLLDAIPHQSAFEMKLIPAENSFT